MGGGKEQKKTNAMLDTNRAAATKEHNQYMDTVNRGTEGATNRAADMYNTQYQGFKDFAEGKYNFGGGGIGGGGGRGGMVTTDPRLAPTEESYRDFMKGGGVDAGTFNKFQGNLTNLAETGGWSPERIASMNQNIGGFKRMGESGGVDAQGQARMRGGGVFDEFAREGGLSAADRGNIRSRATSTIPAFYRQLQDESNRAAAVQGGYGPGRGAMAARLSRDQATAGAGAAREAELGIMQQVNQGRQWGGQNMANSEAALQSLLSQNRLAGLQGASQTEAGMVNAIAQNRFGAANAGAGNEIGMQGLMQKGKMFGTQGLEGMAESAMARSNAAAGQGAADARWEADFNRDTRMMGLEGMQSLYGMKPGEVNMYLDKNLEGRGLAYGQQQDTINQRMANNPKRDWASTIGGFAGAAGGAMTGLGALGMGRQGGAGLAGLPGRTRGVF